MSFIVPVAAPFMMLVLSVILKMRVASLPLIVNVLFFWSTAETIPWNGIGRLVCLPADVDGAGEVGFVVVCAASDNEKMRGATIAAAIK